LYIIPFLTQIGGEHMTDSGCKVRGKIQATKQWLSRAEENFGQDATVRGEMNLLLAEAELRSTRETLHDGPRRLKWAGYKHGIALGVAALMAAGGLGSTWWWWHDVPDAAVASPIVAISPVAVSPAVEQPLRQKILAAPVTNPETIPAAAVEPMIPRQEVNNAVKPATKENPVSSDEMKRLVRAAGQSLRGQPKP
jgi:hypothetical protein